MATALEKHGGLTERHVGVGSGVRVMQLSSILQQRTTHDSSIG